MRFTPDRDMNVRKIKIICGKRKIPALVVSPKVMVENAPVVLWIHGGGYMLGMKEMVYSSRAFDLVKKYGAVVVSPGYRLAFQAPFPAAIEDCYTTLLWIKEHLTELKGDPEKIMTGGESAGGGLCTALCLMARDKGEVKISFQMPLYPMLDNFDTESSKDNHGKIWNTKLNHIGWHMYLRKNAKKEVSPYASPSREKDYSGLPPCYTFVGDGEPFYCETLKYVEELKKAGVDAQCHVYHTSMHAFDMLRPKDEISRQAAEKFNARFEQQILKQSEHRF